MLKTTSKICTTFHIQSPEEKFGLKLTKAIPISNLRQQPCDHASKDQITMSIICHNYTFIFPCQSTEQHIS